MDERGGESVARADGVGNFHGKTWMFMVGVGGDERAAVGAAGDADQAQGKFAAQPTSGGNIGAAENLLAGIAEDRGSGEIPR